MTTFQKTLIGATLAAVSTTIPIVLQRQAMNQLRADNDYLRTRLTAAPTAPPANQATNTYDTDELARLRAEHVELLRSRGEVTRLRAEAVRASQQSQPIQSKAAVNSQPASTQAADTIGGHEIYNAELLGKPHADLVKMMKQVGATMMMAGRYGLPLELKSSKENPTEVSLGSASAADLDNNQFEILVPSSTNFMELRQSIPGAIVARSKEAIPTPDGKWVRVYTRADGSAVNLIHSSQDEAFGFGDPDNDASSNRP